jgi:prepilin peptidase CpaA
MLVASASFAAAAVDLRSCRIPNVLTFPLFIGGFAWGFGSGGLLGGLEALGAAVLVGGPFVLLFVLGFGGAGDAKMMGAIGAWLGVSHGILVLVAVLVVGALGGLLFALVTGELPGVLRRSGRIAQGLLLFMTPLRRVSKPMLLAAGNEGVKLPYGYAIFLGVCLGAAGSTWWMT